MPDQRSLTGRACGLARYALSVLFLLAASTVASGAPSRELLQEAETCFEQGVREKKDLNLSRKHFADAVRKFARLHAEGAQNAHLYLNWGNAELLADHVPQAILAYRRGLRLAPARHDLLENLAFAQNRIPHPPVADTPPPDHAWLSLFPWLARHGRLTLCLSTILFYSLASLSFVYWFKLRPSWLPVRAVLWLLLAGTSGFFWHREEGQLQYERAHPMVVIARETVFHRGNGPSYPVHPTVPTLYAGMEARRLFERGGWLQIQLPGGAIGWVPGDAGLVDES